MHTNSDRPKISSCVWKNHSIEISSSIWKTCCSTIYPHCGTRHIQQPVWIMDIIYATVKTWHMAYAHPTIGIPHIMGILNPRYVNGLVIIFFIVCISPNFWRLIKSPHDYRFKSPWSVVKPNWLGIWGYQWDINGNTLEYSPINSMNISWKIIISIEDFRQIHWVSRLASDSSARAWCDETLDGFVDDILHMDI